MISRVLLLLLLVAGPVQAQTAADTARQAAAQLTEAAIGLEQALTARDRVEALTAVIRAYEGGCRPCATGCARWRSANAR